MSGADELRKEKQAKVWLWWELLDVVVVGGAERSKQQKEWSSRKSGADAENDAHIQESIAICVVNCIFYRIQSIDHIYTTFL